MGNKNVEKFVMPKLEDDLSDPKFEAELSFYQSEHIVDNDVSMYYNQSIQKGNAATSKAKSGKGMIDSLEHQMDSIRESLSKWSKQTRQFLYEKNKNKAEIAKLRRERKYQIYFSSERRETNARIKDLKKQSHEQKESRIEQENQHKKQINKLARLKSRYEEKKKEIFDNSELAKKISKYNDKIIASARKQFKIVEQVKSILAFSKTLDYNALYNQVPQKLAILKDFQAKCKNMPKVSILNPITEVAPELIQAYNQVFNFLSKDEKMEVQDIEQTRLEERDKYIDKRMQLQIPALEL